MQVEGREDSGEDDRDDLLRFEDRTSRVQRNVAEHSLLVRHDGQVGELLDWFVIQVDLNVGGIVDRWQNNCLEITVLPGAFELDISFIPSVGFASDEESGVRKCFC